MKFKDAIKKEQWRKDKNMHVDEFQDMMRWIYFHRDSKRGIVGTYKWLVEEIDELGEALKGKDRKALEDEFADAFAWLASLANVANINLEKAALAKYDERCPKCQQSPCKCPFRSP
jgi:NTP pyrophosphatase (non-canonical NTP hydrolase)